MYLESAAELWLVRDFCCAEKVLAALKEGLCCTFNDIKYEDLIRGSCDRCVVSGAGKVAMHALEKLIAFGAVPLTISG